jgi:hypothetical protein
MTRWKYDADEKDPLTKMRIPVTSDYPGHDYTACFHRDSAQRPTEAEARLLVSFIEEYQERWFGLANQRKIRQDKPFDMGCPATWIFHKWGNGDWSYRVDTWRVGPHFLPVAPRLRGTQYDTPAVKGPMSLAQVMDVIHRVGEEYPDHHWVAWKLAHPEVFGESEESRDGD